MAVKGLLLTAKYSMWTKDSLVTFFSHCWVACAVITAMFETARRVWAPWSWIFIPVKTDWTSSLIGRDLGSKSRESNGAIDETAAWV